jgi:hypothetical protein
MKQRQQLLQLQQTIQTSPDPEGTLNQVAQANDMAPEELVNMLNKNARDLQQDPSLVQPTTIPSTIMKVLGSVGVVISQSARKNPRTFTVSSLALLFLLYATITIPRTGLHLSSGRSLLLSNGPTTLFPSRQSYLQNLVDSSWVQNRPLSIKTKKTKWDDLTMPSTSTSTKEDAVLVHVHKLPRKSELSQAVSAQVSLSPDDYLHFLDTQQFDDDDDDDDDEKGQDDTEEQLAEKKEQILELLFENAANALSSRQLTEFSPSDHTNDNKKKKKQQHPPMRVVASSSSDRQKHGLFMVPGLGDYGRYGLVFWQVTRQLETDKDSSLTLTTLKGMGFFDGQIHCEIKKYRSKIVVTVHLAVPKRGRKISKAMATKIVDELAQSLSNSASQRTQQTLARRTQGKRFQSASHNRAQERRKSRFQREKQIEEMAEERRRKWQRTNPDAGRYRPSGDRQRSPKNC